MAGDIRQSAHATTQETETLMYIGGGVLVLILIIVIVVLLLRG